MKPDFVALVEAAYQVHEDDLVWLRGLLEAALPHLDAGFGVFGFFLDASNLAEPRVEGPQLVGGPAGSTEVILQIDRALRLGADEQRRMGILDGEDIAGRLWARSHVVMTATQAAGADRWSNNAAVRKWAHPFGVRDTLGIKVLDLARRGVCLGAALPRPSSPSRRMQLLWGQVASHIAAGDRLRRRLLREAREGHDRLGTAEAILRPDGHIEHAVDAAKCPSSREALRTMAVSMDRARGALRRRDPEEALSIWRALVDGRWTLLDHFDRDGRRYLVARRNDVDPSMPAALSLRERQIVGFAALGHSVKLIGYELGLSGPTVSTHLGSAMTKLGVRTRAELVQLCAPMIRDEGAFRTRGEQVT
jgi:DNA-binding CsgD family transcriptional regulator